MSPRTPDAGVPRSVLIALRLTQREADALNALKGSGSRSGYIRQLLHDAERREKARAKRG